VSKTRRRSTKKTSSRGARAPRARAKGAKTIKVEKVELRPIRTKLKTDVERLGRAINQSAEPRPKLEEALKRMSRFLADIQDICGSDMSIPIS
jgi:hypothetical protein